MLYRIYTKDEKIIEAPKKSTSMGNDWVTTTGASMLGVRADFAIHIPVNSILNIVEVLEEKGYKIEQDEKDKEKELKE